MDWTDPAQVAAFFALHSDLPSEGPGDRPSLERALALAHLLPDAGVPAPGTTRSGPPPRDPGIPAHAGPRPADALDTDHSAPPGLDVLDIACGPGGQTLDLADLLPTARITALDLHEPFLHDLRRRATALGHADRIRPVLGDMARLPFAPRSFDLILCEGAAYILGLPAALAAWRPLLRAGGILALTEPVWLRADPPAAIRALWADYPAMGTPEATRDAARRAGYRLRGDFVLPPEAWWAHYYGPLEARIAAQEATAPDAPTRLVLADARAEIEAFRHHDDCYGYLFLVL